MRDEETYKWIHYSIEKIRNIYSSENKIQLIVKKKLEKLEISVGVITCFESQRQ